MSEDEEKTDCEDKDDGKVATRDTGPVGAVGTGVGIPAMHSMHKIIRENSKQRYP